MGVSRCSICETPSKSSVINALLASGHSPGKIEARMRELNVPVKEETIRKHRNTCPMPSAMQAQEALAATANGKGRDFAAMVRDNAVALMEQGRMTVRATDGLKAQELLDRREEKKADRDLMVNIARLLSGAFMAPPPRIIEGEAVEVVDGLAPARLVTAGG